jgi:hypothetical protein
MQLMVLAMLKVVVVVARVEMMVVVISESWGTYY